LASAGIHRYTLFHPESIEWFVEKQAFSPSYDLDRPYPALPSLALPPTGRLRKRDNLLTGKGVGEGVRKGMGKPNHTAVRGTMVPYKSFNTL
jgi:hypothetical protein